MVISYLRPSRWPAWLSSGLQSQLKPEIGGGLGSAITITVHLPATGAGSADTSTIIMVIGGGPYPGLTPPIRCGRTGIHTSKVVPSRRLRPAEQRRAEAGYPPPSCEPPQPSPNHDGVSELKGRGFVPQRLYRLARPPNGERPETKDPTEN